MAIDVILVRAAGTNCDRELERAFTVAGAMVSTVHLNALIADPALLERPAILAFPGGFSYGDDIASGKIFANQLRQHLAGPLRAFVDAGKMILGVCNGFQILIKAGLLPGPLPQLAVEDTHPATLTHNTHGRFEDRWVRVRSCSSVCKWLPRDVVMDLPIAHGEGRFVTRDAAVLEHLKANDQIAFRYVDAKGDVAHEFPENPNGSTEAIAGICDVTGRVLGLMPHPERAINPNTLPAWTRGGKSEAALGLFTAALDYVRERQAVVV